MAIWGMVERKMKNKLTDNNQPAITCPNQACNQKFRVSLQDFLYKKSIQCPYCLLELTLDRDQSCESIKVTGQINTD